MTRSQQKSSEVHAVVYVAVMLFSMSTWMDVVGVWIEMPLFVTVLPEAWSLPSYLVIIIQLSNVGPAVYAIVEKFRRGNGKSASSDDCKPTKRVDGEVVTTLVIIIVAAVNIFVLSFLWPITCVVGGHSHSIVMLTLMVPTALTSCMTSLVFLPYMARFPSSYISAFYVGQGFSGLVPGIIGLIQGAGSPADCIWNGTQLINNTVQNIADNMTVDRMMNATAGVVVQNRKPLFSVRIFFLCLAALFILSLFAFCSVNFSKCGRSAMVGNQPKTDAALGDKHCNCLVTSGVQPAADVELHEFQLVREQNESTELRNGANKCHSCSELLENSTASGRKANEEQQTNTELQNRVFIWLLIVIAVVNALSNGLLPSTESYTCLPYGYLVYTLAVRLSSVAASLASLSSLFVPRASVRVVSVMTLIGLVIAIFHTILALQSPNPILRGHLVGDIIVVSNYLFLHTSLRVCSCTALIPFVGFE